MKKTILIIGLLSTMFSCISQTPKSDEHLTYFSFDHHNSMRRFNGESYKVSTEKDGRIHVIIDEAFPQEKEFYLEDATIFDELKAIVDEYKMDKYKSDYHPLMHITDGDSWSLYYKYDSKRSVSSGGYMDWPKNYREARKALSDYFQKWRDYPVPAKEINLFQYTCHNDFGCDIEYRMERGENEAKLYIRNAEHQYEDTLSVNNNYLTDLQELANTYRLKEEYSSKPTGDSVSVYRFLVEYSTGDTIDFQSYHTTFLGGLENAFVYFFSKWLPIQGNLVKFECEFNHGYNHVRYYVQKEDEIFKLYYYAERNVRSEYEIAPEVMTELQKLVETFDVDNAKDEFDGHGEWFILASYDSDDHLSVSGNDSERGDAMLKALQDFFAPYLK